MRTRASETPSRGVPDAAYYGDAGDGKLRCELCPRGCLIAEGRHGVCRGRANVGGVMKLTNYGRYASLAVDPIEKKPLYHFHPGATILSIGGMGCNFKCTFCQNAGISQGEPLLRSVTPERLARETLSCDGDNVGLAFTYNEPLTWYEFIRDTAPLVRDGGRKVALVTNGYINPEPRAALLPVIDAMNVDLKSFDDDFYKKYCKGTLRPVKDTIAAAVEAGVHVEVTLLVIPGLNDEPAMIARQAKWLASLSKDIPLHLSRYFPAFKMDIPPTPASTLARAYDAAREHLSYAFLGNVADPDYARTVCPDCGNVLIDRSGYSVRVSGLDAGKCLKCSRETGIIQKVEEK